MSETKTIEVQVYRDADCLPTCAARDGVCAMLRTQRMGTVEVCGYTGRELNRRDSAGFLEPSPDCPLWGEAK